jgi:hypothetical protein
MSLLDQNIRIVINESLGNQAWLIGDIAPRMSRIQHADNSETITLDHKPILRFWPPEIKVEGFKVIATQRFQRPATTATS